MPMSVHSIVAPCMHSPLGDHSFDATDQPVEELQDMAKY
jgi:hypothetical protein